MDATRQHGIQVLFSDIDGTCVMYPDVQSPLTDSAGDQDENGLWPTTALDGSQASLLRLPPSSSGAQGVISARTLQLYASLRALGVKLVLISGGRLSTIMQRLPCLPAADAIVVESGGRIFFPCGSDSLPTAAPLREDLQWRQALSPWAGPPGQDGTAPEARGGVLWRHYADLKTAGFDLDATSYTTAFRVRKPAGRQAELSGGLPSGLAASINLGAVDIYPATSGKAKAAQHLMRHFGTPASGAQCAFMCGASPPRAAASCKQCCRH
jgi:hypothetical protein